MFAGQRRSEILGLRVKDVRSGERRLFVADARAAINDWCVLGRGRPDRLGNCYRVGSRRLHRVRRCRFGLRGLHGGEGVPEEWEHKRR